MNRRERMTQKNEKMTKQKSVFFFLYFMRESLCFDVIITTTTTTMWPWRTVSGFETNEFLDFHILRHCAAEKKEKKRTKK